MTVATVTNRHDGPYCTNRVRGRAHTREACWPQWEPSRRFATVRRSKNRLWPPNRYFRGKVRRMGQREQPPYPAEFVLNVRNLERSQFA